jgi:probable HAF family extracellular repeat protein
MKQLPTGASLYGAAFAINDAGAIAGYGDAPDGQTNAMLWRKTGGKWQATYLGNLHSGDCAEGVSINASGQVVGISGPNGCSTTLAFLWEDGGPMVDLNTLVPPTSGLQLIEAHQINDRGDIAVGASDANGNNHSVLLIPCDGNHPGIEGCDYSLVDAATAAAQSAARPYVPSITQRLPRSRWSGRYHFPGLQSLGR